MYDCIRLHKKMFDCWHHTVFYQCICIRIGEKNTNELRNIKLPQTVNPPFPKFEKFSATGFKRNGTRSSWNAWKNKRNGMGKILSLSSGFLSNHLATDCPNILECSTVICKLPPCFLLATSTIATASFLGLLLKSVSPKEVTYYCLTSATDTVHAPVVSPPEA